MYCNILTNLFTLLFFFYLLYNNEQVHNIHAVRIIIMVEKESWVIPIVSRLYMLQNYVFIDMSLKID